MIKLRRSFHLFVVLILFLSFNAQANSITCNSVFLDTINIEQSIQRAIQLELKLMHHELYGDDWTNPSSDSRLGKYIAQTGSAIKLIRPTKLKSGGGGQGPAKLVVALSANSFEAFKTHFMDLNFMSVLGHAAVLFKGKVYMHYGGDPSDIRLPSVGTPLPMVLMKQSEALRFDRYIKLTASPQFRGWTHALKQPWLLSGYAAEGGYTCCTQWVGNIPIGDRLVDTYSFPAHMEHAGDRSPRIQKLKPYFAVGNDKVLEEVWRVPGHQQFADVLGQRDANLAGEFASPGWVIQTLIGPTTNERVPIIFVVTQDHTLPIPDNIQQNFVFEHTY